MSDVDNGMEGKWALELCEFRQLAHPEIGVSFLKNGWTRGRGFQSREFIKMPSYSWVAETGTIYCSFIIIFLLFFFSEMKINKVRVARQRKGFLVTLQVTINRCVWSGEMAQLVKCLSCRHEDLSSIPQTNMKKTTHKRACLQYWNWESRDKGIGRLFFTARQFPNKQHRDQILTINDGLIAQAYY